VRTGNACILGTCTDQLTLPVRDDWDSSKDGLEKSISDVLGQPWTIEVDMNQLYAYCKEGYAKASTGSMVAQYVFQ
jgi:hypothetical protein